MNEVLLGGLKVAAIGAVAGLLLSAGLSRAMASFLFEVDPTDPWILAAAGASGVLVALLASLVPALRAARSSPAAVLRGGD